MSMKKVKPAVFVAFFRLLLFCLTLLHAAFVFGGPEENLARELLAKGIAIDLRSPSYSDGVLKTCEGGVIAGPNIRIQASSLTYTNKEEDGKSVLMIEAEENVMLEFGNYLFVGNRLSYDFNTGTGVIYQARMALEPWFLGGDTIILCSDGSYIIYNGFVTTSENCTNDWQITSRKATLKENRYLRAENVQFQILSLPLFWLRCFNADLNSIFDSPIRYNIQWRGRQHTRFSMTYEFFSWKRFKASIQLDYRIKRGLGGSLETQYISEDHKSTFNTINYMARDSSIDDPDERFRYLFQGNYVSFWDDDKISVHLEWDKVSDKDMATDYVDNGLELDAAGPTQLLVRRQEDESWIASFLTRVSVNGFQTVNQELPTVSGSLKPFVIGSTGIVSENQFFLSYLNFVYGNQLSHVRDYQSTRFETNHTIYRPYKIGPIQGIPEVGGRIIVYGNSPHDNTQILTFGYLAHEFNTILYRSYGCLRHTIQPYTKYEYLTYPTSTPPEHFIFDINDGWFRLNTLRFGMSQSFYYKNAEEILGRYFFADIFAFAFFDTPTIRAAIPRVYANMVWNALPTLRYSLETAWDFQHGQLYHFNFLTEWTLSQNFAISAEYRHRDAYDWRKVEKYNFILDSFRTTKELLHSSLSDRRDTLLLHFFLRFDPTWAIEFESRHGWNRRFEPSYNEYECDFLATLPSAWNIKIAFQHKENEKNDNRIAFYFSIGMKRPDRRYCENRVPMVKF